MPALGERRIAGERPTVTDLGFVKATGLMMADPRAQESRGVFNDWLVGSTGLMIRRPSRSLNLPARPRRKPIDPGPP